MSDSVIASTSVSPRNERKGADATEVRSRLLLVILLPLGADERPCGDGHGDRK
jgi:hypothetical protein